MYSYCKPKYYQISIPFSAASTHRQTYHENKDFGFGQCVDVSLESLQYFDLSAIKQENVQTFTTEIITEMRYGRRD